MEYKGLNRAMTVLDCRQGLFRFSSASNGAAKQYYLKAIIRWQRDKQHTGSGRGHRVILEVISIFRPSANILSQQMTQRQSQWTACFA